MTDTAAKKAVSLYTNESSFAADLIDVAKLFMPESEFTAVSDNTMSDIVVKITQNSLTVENVAEFGGASFSNSFVIPSKCTALELKRYKKRHAKIALYNCLKKIFPKEIPWGSLTGIRPTKLAYEILHNESMDFREVFRNLFDVSPGKVELISEILEQQKGLRIVDENAVDLYIGIPFCTSRCSYCSFTSGVISKLKAHVAPYVNNLKYEIAQSVQTVNAGGYTVKNVYVGGGTPTSLGADELDAVLSYLDFAKNEFTVEAGRPDTIDDEKLAVLAERGVNRISINPQTFNQATLDAIGRNHTVKDIADKFSLARRYDFSINMDLIAGLPSENFRMFAYSADSAVALAPDNITVHTLALKKGSALKERGGCGGDEEVAAMVDYAREKLAKNGYKPYYIYRQKYVADNLENVGYAKRGKACKYNIDIMEETTSILACGCNAISKRVFPSQNRIERQANPKDVITYNRDLEVYLARKKRLFSVNNRIFLK